MPNNKFTCLTSAQVQSANGKIVTNIDGSVSLFMPSNNVLKPVKLSKACCLKLSSRYIFDENTQKCMWAIPPNCASNDSYKLTLNPIGNDGAIFNVANDETCSLNIEFDYLFKVSCSALMNMAGSPTSFVSSEVRGQINQLQNQIDDQTVLCETLSGQIDILQQQIDDTPYSIVCSSEYITPESLPAIPSSTVESYSNTGFGVETQAPVDGTGAEYSSSANQNVGTYCLTSNGLTAFQSILGTGYTSFLNGDPNSYTCSDVDALILQDDSTNNLVYPCDIPFGTKNAMMANMSVLEQQLADCNSTLDTLTTELNALTANTPTILSDCSKPINYFETLDVSMTLDVVENNQTTPVYEAYDVFSAIGNGNLYNYLTTHTNSGFYVYNEATGDPLDIKTNKNFNSCKSLPSNLLNDLSNEANLSIQQILNNISSSAFTSSWLHYSTTITDPDIIALIADKKIKISLNVNNTCTDMCVLLDNIKLNKECDRVTKTNIFVTECPGFDLDRIRDNKKSWINNTTLVNRDFEIFNAKGVKPIRQTNYNTEDERLVLNSKEIDLDVNLAAAIETDVWCYISDNPCLLTGTSNCDQCLSACCGDNRIDFNSLLTQPLSAVTVVEDFEYYLTSELIDAKSRQTLSAYPTLRALYDRYMSSSAYCGTNSSAFDYNTMDKFAGLVGDYWVDIVEQVIPATTIWGSVKVYSNTIFDEQKFKYKAYTSFFCDNSFSGETVPSPINGTSGASQSVGVEIETITTGYTGNIGTGCNEIRIMQLNYGSEFIGQVSELNGTVANSNLSNAKTISSD